VQAPLNALVHYNRAANNGADTCVNFGIEGSRVAPGDLNAGQLAWTTRGQMLTPNAGKLHTLGAAPIVVRVFEPGALLTTPVAQLHCPK
jgi:hypothetical protein